MDITELTPKQQKAFNRMKKAYEDCLKENVNFIGWGDSFYAVDRDKIEGSTDSPGSSFYKCVSMENLYLKNEISNIGSAWVDVEPFLITKENN